MNYILKTMCLLIGIINFLFAISFAKKFGGEDEDIARSIQQTNDGGYIVAGYTFSFGVGEPDFLVIKLDSMGDVEWAKTFGGVGGAYFIQQTNDRGYVVLGTTVGTRDCDFLVIKLDSQGDIEWAKTFSGGYDDYALSIQQTNDGGYIVGGYTSLGGGDFLVIKLDSQGDIEWARTFGGENSDVAFSIKQTNEGGYIVVGWTYSFGSGDCDCLVIKLDSQGNIEWVKTFGGVDHDAALSIQQTSEGGYILTGETYSFGVGNEDCLVIKLNSEGNIEWAKTFGGQNYERARSIQQTNDGGYIIAGTTSSFGLGYYDFLVIKTQDGQMVSDCPWYNCNPIVTSPDVFVNSPSLTVTSPTLTTTSPSLFTSSHAVSIYYICGSLAQENIYFPKENIKLESSIFLKDKISLIFSGYSKEKIKFVLYDVSGKEIISNSFYFNNYIEIKDKRIKKIKRGIYFLKVYWRGKEIGSLKIIKE